MDVALLRGATVIDGTGAPARAADVAIGGGTVLEVGEPGGIDPSGADVVDLSGEVLAPGFIDVHTHFDAQILWDPDLTPSCWHGVTTVVIGNCGFGIAPTRPEHRRAIIRTLENVEGMSAEALEAGIPWTFETFPEYLDTLRANPTRLNVAAYIGHTPLRMYVLGDEAMSRAATDGEIAEMRRLVAEALAAGAVGFATSKTPLHVGVDGNPVPSRLAELDEVQGIADALKTAGCGVFQASVGPGLFIRELAELSGRIGRPVTWAALLTGGNNPPAMAALERQSALGGEVWPQVACRPIVTQITLADPFTFGTVPAFKEILALAHPERAGLYSDRSWRHRAKDGMDETWNAFWHKVTVQESQKHPELCNGPTLAVLAAQQGVDPFDLLVDLGLEEDLRTRFQVVLTNDNEEEIGLLLRDPRTLLGLSDAGAHASQLCDAGFSTHLLEHWVRETAVLTLEQAVWRLTGQPSAIFGLNDRGRIAPGFAADLVAFDPATIGLEPPERIWDLPGGADRLVVQSRGISATWVNGVPTRRQGRDLPGARPGRLISRSSDGQHHRGSD